MLDLIELKLLRADPSARYNIEELCEKLKKLSNSAEGDIKSLKKHSRDTDPIVMKALKKIEEEALIQRSSEPKINLLQQPLLQVNPRERASMQINKEELIRQKPLGQTAHRKQILEEKLENCDVMKINDTPLPSGIHNGDYTQSPTDATSSKELPYNGREVKPIHPDLRAPGQDQSDRGHQTPSGPPKHGLSSFPATPPSTNHRKWASDAGSASPSDDRLGTTSHAPLFSTDSPTSSNLRKPVLHLTTPVSPLDRYSGKIAQSIDAPSPPSTSEEKRPMFQNFNHTPSSVSTPENTAHMAKSHAHIHEQSAIGRGLGDQNPYIPENLLHHKIGTGDVPVTNDTSLMKSAIDDKRIQVPTIGVPSTSEHAEIGPSIMLSQSKDSESPQNQSAVSQSSSHAHEKQLVEEDHTPHTYNLSGSNIPILLTLPPTVLSLPYDICLRRKDLDEQTTKGLAMFTKVKGSLGIETRARDSSLIETFSDPRELVRSIQRFRIFN